MSDQFSLFAEAPADPTDRLFFGVFPQASVARTITTMGEALRQRRGLRRPLLQESRFHITLVHIGDYVGLPRDGVGRAEEAARQVIAHPFEVRFDRIASFHNGPVVLLGDESDLAALSAYRQSLMRAIAATGLKTKSNANQFKPHVTLLYDRPTPIEPEPCAPIEWRVEELVLIHSRLRQTLHIPLGRWPLRGF